jgi:hypothetical protein
MWIYIEVLGIRFKIVDELIFCGIFREVLWEWEAR